MTILEDIVVSLVSAGDVVVTNESIIISRDMIWPAILVGAAVSAIVIGIIIFIGLKLEERERKRRERGEKWK